MTNLKGKTNLLIRKTLGWHLYISMRCKTASSIFEQTVLLTVLSSIFKFLTVLLKSSLKVSPRSTLSVIIVSFCINEIDSFEKDFYAKETM